MMTWFYCRLVLALVLFCVLTYTIYCYVLASFNSFWDLQLIKAFHFIPFLNLQ